MKYKVGLLRAARKYPRRHNHDPLENFITEVFCWVLENEPSYSNSLLNELVFNKKSKEWSDLGRVFEKPIISWETQLHSKVGFFDLVCKIIQNRSESIIIFENKTWSGFSGVNQIKKYSEYAKNNYSHSVIVFISGYNIDPKGVDGLDLAYTWNQIYDFTQDWLLNNENETELNIQINEFLDLLDSIGLGKNMKIETDMLESYSVSYKIPELIKKLISRMTPLKIEWLQGLIGEKIEEFIKWEREGVICIRIGKWCPGISVGVMLNGNDHCMEEEIRKTGPDFYLSLDFDKKYHNVYQNSEFYKLLIDKISEKCKEIDYEFYNQIKSKKREKNYWHPIIIRKPLSKIIQNCNNFEEQVVEIIDELQRAIAVVDVDEFWSLRHALSK